MISPREIKGFAFRTFRPFQNDIYLKFYGTSKSVGVLKICLHLGLGVGLRGKLE